jgi:aryl-phospho-beta-D-glucosidase BglC (GH1 family)
MRKRWTAGLVALAIAALGMATAKEAQAKTTGFVHAEGRNLVDPSGHRLLLRGTNLGNWLIQEGYMFHLDGGPQSAREIEELTTELMGPVASEEFWKQYRQVYITKADIDFIAHEGFNTIRIPFHYRFFTPGKDDGFALLDPVIAWAKTDHLYVVLDMHAAPCGQNGANIDDSYGYPWLYDSPECQQQTDVMWQRIAEHYRDNSTVLGYDLLNEPIPHYPRLHKYNAKLEPVYRGIVAAVRKVDQNHVLILGGAQWDTNFTVFSKPFDNNVMYTFHKYWMPPVHAQIQAYMDFSAKYNVPIWMSESGENKDEWITEFRTLLDKNEISWTFWPYKKMDATSALVSFDRPEHWDEIVAFAAHKYTMGDSEKAVAARPPQADIDAAFRDLLVKVRFENAHANPGYLKALGAPAP